MISKVGAVSPHKAGIGIGLLFKLLRATAAADIEATHRPHLEERQALAMAERDREIASRGEQLNRMRMQSNAQTQMVLGERGVSPMYTMGMGGGGMRQGAAPAHIMAAAASQPPPVGRVG